MALVAGVDLSTQATKVGVRDADTGEVVAAGRAPHPAVHPPRSEQDPAAWWAAFEQAWAGAGSPTVDAIAVGGQQHGMVVLDGTGEVVRPAKLWNDTESAPDAGWLLKQLPDGAAGWAAACGTVPVAAITVTKLSWLHRSEPESWARLARVLLPHDWLTYRLTGAFTTDRGDASGTGYWSPAASAYRWDLLAIVDNDRDWSTAVPEVLGPAQAAGSWRSAVVGPGTGDNMAAALGLGLGPGDVAISIGTSGTVYAVSDTPTADGNGDVAGFADATGRFLPLVCTLNAAKVTDTVARLLGVDHGGLDALALSAPPGAGGLVLLPYFDGERTPNRPTATGVLSGLRSDVTAAQLARAAVEGVVCGLLDGLDALSALVPTGGRLLLVGGGAESAAFAQVLADLAGRPVVLPAEPELVATGAAVQAAAVLRDAAPGEVARQWAGADGRTVEPGPGAVAGDEVRAAYAARRDAEA
jgi:xylulokinase